MRIKKANSNAATLVVQALQNNEIVIIPTDTVYGFSGIFGKTSHLISAIKGRAEQKPLIALIAEPEDIYTYTDAVIPANILQQWPAPLTLVVPLKGSGTQAFRCPADEWLRNLIAKTGSALYSTSVNTAGTPPLSHIDKICTLFEHSVSIIVDAGTLHGIPSTIVDLCSTTPRILRQGAIHITAKQ